MFDRGISRGDTPRLWIDMVAHVHMGRDKRRYRFVQDTRYGRKLLAESNDIQRHGRADHALRRHPPGRARARARRYRGPAGERMRRDVADVRRRRRWSLIRTFVFGLVMGFAVVLGALWLAASRVH